MKASGKTDNSGRGREGDNDVSSAKTEVHDAKVFLRRLTAVGRTGHNSWDPPKIL